MTPGSSKSFTIHWAAKDQLMVDELVYGSFHYAPVGELLFCRSSHGLCYLGLCNRENPAQSILGKIRRRWPTASLSRETTTDTVFLDKLQHNLDLALGLRQPAKNCAPDLQLHLHASAFEQQVWMALCDIAPGHTMSYRELASKLSAAGAARATGSAVGRNPISLLLPCHRVIRSNGSGGNYLWGEKQKQDLLALEARLTSKDRPDLTGLT